MNQGRSQGKGKIPPKPKNLLLKMGIFPNALFLVTNFPKIVKNSLFLLNFHQKFSKFPNTVFRPNARKIIARFVNFLKDMLEIMHFKQFS